MQVNGYLIPELHFIFRLDGEEMGTFQTVSGLGAQIEMFSIREGGENQYVHQKPGRMIWNNLVLKSGVTNADIFLPWLMKLSGDVYALLGHQNLISRGAGVLEMCDFDGSMVKSWEFDHAIPVRWTGPDMSIDAGQIATEELEIAHHGLRPIVP